MDPVVAPVSYFFMYSIVFRLYLFFISKLLLLFNYNKYYLEVKKIARLYDECEIISDYHYKKFLKGFIIYILACIFYSLNSKIFIGW